jgi:hypothetical protein
MRVALALALGLLALGCRISRNIRDLERPADLPPLQELEQHLNYQDPDAGEPDYVRTE